MTIQELLTQLTTEVNNLESQVATLTTQNTALNAQVVALQANQLPTGIVNIVIDGVDMSKVTIS